MFAIIHAQTISAPRLADGESWALTRAMSPRPSVRVAGVDAYGALLNEYVSTARVAGPVPEVPWAVYLAGADQRFRLLCFDLDAKTAGAAAAAAAHDADVLVELLTGVGLNPVVCASGPTGGRHVWVALAESVDAATVATLARFTQKLCPSLDLSPMTNPVTGCVRPPGAPHRHGGHSTPISGNASVLGSPTGTAASVVLLVERLAALIEDCEHSPALDPQRPLPLDKHARKFLPGQRRDLPAFSIAALTEDSASGDASAVLWRVLIGAAVARWRHADIAALVSSSPGLEHIRSQRNGGYRVPRERADARSVLCRQWDKAVTHVATSRRRESDPTFDARADEIAAQVRHIQAGADAAAGRWVRGGGPADRRVLDVLCVLALEAMSATVEADTRRLALLAGIGRETARTALLRLSGDGWIERTRGAAGPHGAHWQIRHGEGFHRDTEIARSQVDPRPRGAGTTERSLLLNELTARVASSTHDVFTPSPALGLFAGNVYARTSTTPLPTDQLAHSVGASQSEIIALLDRLAATGLLIKTSTGWRRHVSDERGAAAKRLDVHGRLEERSRRYKLEREQWAWWQAEQTWMQAPRRTHPTRRAGPHQLSLLPDFGTHAYGPYPRRDDGRADHRAAHQEIMEQRDGVALRPAAQRWSTSGSHFRVVA